MSSNRHIFNWFAAFANQLSSRVGKAIAWLTLVMMLLMTLVVVLRYVFSIGSIALQEGVLYLHAIVLMLGMASTLQSDEHVRVDIFYRRFNPNKKSLVNLLGHLFFLIPVCIFIIVMSWNYVLQSWQILEGSQEAGGLPLVFVLKSLLFIMPGLLIIQALADICGFFVAEKEEAPQETDSLVNSQGGK